MKIWYDLMIIKIIYYNNYYPFLFYVKHFYYDHYDKKYLIGSF